METNYKVNGRDYIIGKSITDKTTYEATPIEPVKTEHERVGEIARN